MLAFIGIFFVGVFCGVALAAILHAGADADERGEFYGQSQSQKGDGAIPVAGQDDISARTGKKNEDSYEAREKTH